MSSHVLATGKCFVITTVSAGVERENRHIYPLCQWGSQHHTSPNTLDGSQRFYPAFKGDCIFLEPTSERTSDHYILKHYSPAL